MIKIFKNINWTELSGLFVGAFIALFLVAVSFVVFYKLESEGIFREQYYLLAEVEQGQGLRIGTKVQINGVNVGSVERMELAGNGKVRMALAIGKEYQPWVTDSARAYAVRDQNLLSERVINIDISRKGDRVLRNNEYISAGSAQDIEAVLKAANELLARIDKLVVTADTLLGMIVDTNTTVGMLLGSRVLFDRVDTLVQNLGTLAGGAQGVMDTVQNALPQVTAFVGKTAGAVEHIFTQVDGTLGDLGGTIRNINELIDSTQGLVGSVKPLLNDVSGTLGKAGELVDGVGGIWPIKNHIAKKDTVPLMTEETW
jgi:phospholipid/cholesterol/gamma-HCH transport system substrate-binding protein